MDTDILYGASIYIFCPISQVKASGHTRTRETIISGQTFALATFVNEVSGFGNANITCCPDGEARRFDSPSGISLLYIRGRHCFEDCLLLLK